jgi:HEAT repeat protein
LLSCGCIGNQNVEKKTDDLQNLKNPDSSIRLQVVNNIINNENKKAAAMDQNTTDALIEVLKTDTKSFVRERAANALSYSYDKKVVDPLIQALNDTDAKVRISAAISLGDLYDQKAIGPLTNALNDENSVVRDSAAESLKKIEKANKSSNIAQSDEEINALIEEEARKLDIKSKH